MIQIYYSKKKNLNEVINECELGTSKIKQWLDVFEYNEYKI